MVNPLVEDVLKGKSGLLAAMGPSGSGKTHTVFGSARDPALRQTFSDKESSRSKCSRTFHLSMFEIYSERGKGEKIMDLSPDGGDLSMQQSTIKGLQEVVIRDVQQAESFIPSGMLKRSMAMTNSNLQPSRSQCIISIRCEIDTLDDAAAQSSAAMLTIVDLAGAEREKRTGNQGTRLLESNFINNTSMVFGLCLRSLLEHQKNRKKPLHKHFQNSLLTKYLCDFLQGKKRMALILTAKSGEEDYQDTSYLLRQAAPYMNIKFENVEEQPANTFGNQRRTQILSKTEQQVKRTKLNSNGVSMDDELKSDILHQPNKEVIPKKDEDAEFNGSSAECPVIIDSQEDYNKFLSENATNLSKTARENQILLKFSRVLWNVLIEYKSKLDANIDEVSSLRRSLTAEKERCSVLETELILMKASCSCGKEAVVEVKENDSKAKLTNCTVELERYQPIDVLETITEISSSHAATLEISTDTVYAQVSTSNLCEEHVDSGLVSGLNGTAFVQAASTSLSVQNFEDHSNEKEYVLFDKEDLKELGDLDFSCEESDTITRSAEAISVSSEDEKCVDQSVEELNESSPNAVFDKQEFSEVEDTEADGEITGCESLDSAALGSTLLSVVDDEVSSILEEGILESTINAQVTGSAEVISASSEEEKFLEQINKEIDEPSSNALLDKKDLAEVENREANGERSGFDSLASAFEEDKPEKNETEVPRSVEVISVSNEPEMFEEQINQKIDELSPNVLLVNQEVKEVEARAIDGERTGCDGSDTAARGSDLASVVAEDLSNTLDEEKSVHEKKEVPDQNLVLPGDVISSQKTNASKLLKSPSVVPCQSNPIKPKRRLRPASSVMLRNINILEFDDATEMPKQHHGKRGEKEDVGRKRTQGSLSLLRLLKQNPHH